MKCAKTCFLVLDFGMARLASAACPDKVGVGLVAVVDVVVAVDLDVVLVETLDVVLVVAAVVVVVLAVVEGALVVVDVDGEAATFELAGHTLSPSACYFFSAKSQKAAHDI